MTDVMNGILAEAKKNKYSTIRENLTEDDVAAVWENVSRFIEKQMSQQKGVQIQSLGTFTFSQKKLDIGNNKFILIQRPVFNISEKLAQSQGLQYVKHHVPGQIPVVQLNFAAMSFESPYDRDTVESCVREILGAVQRAIGSKRNVELTFGGIGKLMIRDSRVKMKFFKEFINQMDGSGKLLDSMQNRPGTVDSVMSERPITRAHSSNTVVLPKNGNKKGISNTSVHQPNGGLPPLEEQAEGPEGAMDYNYPMGNPTMEDGQAAPNYYNHVSTEEGMDGPDNNDVDTDAAIRHIEMGGDEPILGQAGPVDTLKSLNMDTEPRPAVSYRFLPELADFPGYASKRASIPASRAGSRMAAPIAMATGVSLLDDLVPSAHTPKSAPSQASQRPSPPPADILHKPQPPTQLAPLHRSMSFDQMRPGDRVMSPPGTACGHSNAGQELCYLCHQRARRNIPVSFAEERRQREEEEDRLLQQYQYMKDAENVLQEQEINMAKRNNLQKMAAFNLGVSEAVHQKKRERDTSFHKSYIFQRRPLTPPRFIKQTEYSGDLAKQVEHKETVKAKRQSDEEFLERLEQVQLAEDLAIQREQFMREKAEEQEKYKKALETQVRIRVKFNVLDDMNPRPVGNLSEPSESSSNLRLPYLTTIRPFSQPNPARLNEDWKPFLRFKPLQVPAREPDKEMFGKNDMTNEKMAERRRRAYDLFQEQQDLVAQRKREMILKRLAEQREEEQVLEKTKEEMMEDRANKFQRRTNLRHRLEQDWTRATVLKRERLEEDKLRALSPGMLLHEQCDKYNRCGQCKRQLKNCGESNLWSESRYIPGSRLMV
ncbi:coiled-coil domain-containing protein 81-like isoform X2 [Dreissena polymorpha]|uniref:coiled-coil domain-containing protein 81-like isoform X2 n=1 Tax=Dreissena polymorpha TaxID=45954 RepID=UPI002263AE0A|nr:coiled-coil domain-containing protein 81-like isoform X2 [Dreissena polymorpha]